ncbi:putative protein phosphatase 2C 47-like [Capsicum annuum]|nr:putative protein phosphatase 2C 47-like [Capsicum annuum]
MSIMSLDYWFQWQVAICAVIFIIPTVVALRLIISKRRRRMNEQNIIKSTDLWIPCWRNLHPIWLLCFRASAFLAMVFLLYQTVANLGFFVFLFYTQWTFALVGIYFALGTIISARGCWLYTRNPLSQPGERDKFLKKAVEENSSEQQLGLWENSMLIMYQATTVLCFSNLLGLVSHISYCGAVLTLFSSGVYMSAAYLGGRILSWNSTLHGRRYGISEWLWFTSLVTDYTVCLSELKTEYSRDCFQRHFLGRLTELPAVFQKVSMFKNMKFLVIKLGLDQCGGEIAMEKKHS